MKKVSVIVPVYKSELFLDKLIQSIQEQTYLNLEIILVDDGSPDRSGYICDLYAKNDPRIKVIHKENGGTCEARNYGLQATTGYYIFFADGDDWLYPNCIEYLVTLAEANDAEMSMTDSVFTTSNLRQNKKDLVKILSPEEAACFILYVNTPVGPWNKLYTAEVIKKNNISFSVPWFGEGLYFSVMNAQLSNRVAMGHQKVYVYRKNNGNSGTTERKVQNGINSLNNIVYIKERLVFRTKHTINACNWHIWKNHYNLIMYIVGSREQKQYKDIYKYSKKYVKMHGFKSILASKVSAKQKIYNVLIWLFPVLVAKVVIKIRNKRVLLY